VSASRGGCTRRFSPEQLGLVRGQQQERTRTDAATRATIVAVSRPEGFEYEERDGEVVVRHRGRRATTLRGEKAWEFLAEVGSGDAQLLMARVTGNYRRGNERTAKVHPRNASRGR